MCVRIRLPLLLSGCLGFGPPFIRASFCWALEESELQRMLCGTLAETLLVLLHKSSTNKSNLLS